MKIDDGLVRILLLGEGHKYLGRKLCADPRLRTETELKNRIAKAWGAYAKHRHILANRSIPLQLRMKLFEATVTPTALFALPSLTLTATQYACLARAQRKMLRNIVGWVRTPDEPWDDTRTRMRTRLRPCWQHTRAWAITAAIRHWTWAGKVANMLVNRWARQAAEWQHPATTTPAPKRPTGRPRTRWDDNIVVFCQTKGFPNPESWWLTARQHHTFWNTFADEYGFVVSEAA